MEFYRRDQLIFLSLHEVVDGALSIEVPQIDQTLIARQEVLPVCANRQTIYAEFVGAFIRFCHAWGVLLTALIVVVLLLAGEDRFVGVGEQCRQRHPDLRLFVVHVPKFDDALIRGKQLQSTRVGLG